jgi:hypothetical protein
MKNMRFVRSRSTALILGAAAGFAAVAASAFAVTGGGVYIPELGRSVPAEKAAAVRHSLPRSAPESMQPAPQPTPDRTGIAARILGPDVPVPISPALLRTVNGWLVSDGMTLVAVYAGAAGDDNSQGRVVIVRQDLQAGVQTQDVVEAGLTGALSIAGAPIGEAVETSAQRGDLVLGDVNGGMHTLNLASDTIGTK